MILIDAANDAASALSIYNLLLHTCLSLQNPPNPSTYISFISEPTLAKLNASTGYFSHYGESATKLGDAYAPTNSGPLPSLDTRAGSSSHTKTSANSRTEHVPTILLSLTKRPYIKQPQVDQHALLSFSSASTTNSVETSASATSKRKTYSRAPSAFLTEQRDDVPSGAISDSGALHSTLLRAMQAEGNYPAAEPLRTRARSKSLDSASTSHSTGSPDRPAKKRPKPMSTI